MKYIDIDNWKRKDHYNFFKGLDYPHFNICANLDITKFYKFIKENNEPFFLSFLFLAVKGANSVKEFRYRIRENSVVEHDLVSPSFTVMSSNGVFSFCPVLFCDNFNDFFTRASQQIEKTKNHVIISDEPGRDDLLFITSLPWVSFTSLEHPIQMNPVDSIPRIAWGKFFEENGKIKLPFSVQVHHALVDGIHIGEYFKVMEEMLDKPEIYLQKKN